MKLILISLAIVAVYAEVHDQEWTNYKKLFNKVYTAEEDVYRHNIFSAKMHKINEHNLRYFRGLESYTMRLNKLSDMTTEEVLDTHTGFRANNKFNMTGKGRFHQISGNALPESVDWRTKGVVTPVKDQGGCGSCWAFSTTGALEGQHALASGKLVSLSEQNLVDCTTQQGNFGCGGGWPFDAYEYIIRFSEGIDTEASYPYAGIDQTCKYNPQTVGATETAFAILPPDNEMALQDAVANVGPISVCIDADDNFFGYSSGVYDDPTCSSTFSIIDHCVLAVGYGHDAASGKDYWLVKNSWGTSWGDNGYIKMVRNKMNQCAISTLASYPDVKPTL